MTYTIWLGNPYKLHYDWQALCSAVAKIFRPAIAEFDKTNGKRKLHNVRCASTPTLPAIGPQDLLIYVVPTRDFGFGGVDFGSTEEGRPQDNAGLTVATAGQVCSEVFVADNIISGSGVTLRADFLTTKPPEIEVNVKRDPGFMAKTIYHEALHNRTGMADSLHAKSGLSIGRAAIGPADTLSTADKKLMAKHLLRGTVPGKRGSETQWTGGWSAVAQR